MASAEASPTRKFVNVVIGECLGLEPDCLCFMFTQVHSYYCIVGCIGILGLFYCNLAHA